MQNVLFKASLGLGMELSSRHHFLRIHFFLRIHNSFLIVAQAERETDEFVFEMTVKYPKKPKKRSTIAGKHLLKD